MKLFDRRVWPDLLQQPGTVVLWCRESHTTPAATPPSLGEAVTPSQPDTTGHLLHTYLRREPHHN